jgi:protein-disulfide isomerase
MPQANSTEATFAKYFQTGILVIGAFVIGYLFSEVRYLKSGNSLNAKPSTQAQQVGDEPQAETVTLTSIFESIGANADNVKNCMSNGEFGKKVSDETAGGQKAGVNGTPGNFIVVGNNQGEAIAGALPFEQLKPILDQYVSAGKTANTVTLTNLPTVNDQDHLRGEKNAKITVVEYSDFDCPFCSRFHTTMQQVLDEYDGQVNWVYRDFPLPQLHPNAPKLAEAAECIANQNGEEAFWKFADAYYTTKGEGKNVTL